MPFQRIASQSLRFAPLLFLGLLNCAGCEEPWPEPEPSPAKYLTVVPREIFIHVDDPTKPVFANLVAFVHDEYGRNIDEHTTGFTVTTSGMPIEMKALGVNPDTAVLTVKPVCVVGGQTCVTGDIDAVVTAKHPGSGLTFPIQVHVRYAAAGEHGVAAKPVGEAWPMYGVATGSVGNVWQSRMMRPFVSRAGFGRFDATAVNPPSDDESSGAVLSNVYALWRKVDPWGTTPSDMTVPSVEALPPEVRLRAYYAADPALFTSLRPAFEIALQGGADIVSYTPIGARVMLDAPVTQAAAIEWTTNCADLGQLLFASVASSQQPKADVLSIYMMAFSAAAPPGERALHCGAGTMPQFPTAHAIILPQGSAFSSTIAHEIGHALSLGHVSVGSGFFDDNIMRITDDLSAPMRSRLTIGQAYRAALDPDSYIVTSGQAKSTPIRCADATKKCPGNPDDIHGRTP